MNPDRINQVADAIEQHLLPLGFNMALHVGAAGETTLFGAIIEDKSGHNCGTTACIAGWIGALHAQDLMPYEIATADFNETEWLGLDSNTAWDLFYAGNRPDESPPLSDISQEQAVRTLRHRAATGNVDWTV